MQCTSCLNGSILQNRTHDAFSIAICQLACCGTHPVIPRELNFVVFGSATKFGFRHLNLTQSIVFTVPPPATKLHHFATSPNTALDTEVDANSLRIYVHLPPEVAELGRLSVVRATQGVGTGCASIAPFPHVGLFGKANIQIRRENFSQPRFQTKRVQAVLEQTFR